MSFNEPNLHSRNLKLTSMMFILYWVLGLKPIDDSIRLMFVSYEITNPVALAWVSHIILVYFAWRFYLNSRRRIRFGYISSFDTQSFNKKSLIYKKLNKQSEADYRKNHKEQFETDRIQSAETQQIKDFSNLIYNILPISLKYESGIVNLTYQVHYDGGRVYGFEFKNYTIRYKWYNWLLYKLIKVIAFVFKKEESPDFLLPWLMFSMAVASSILRRYGIDVFYFK